MKLLTAPTIDKDEIISIARKAGAAVLGVYGNNSPQVEFKADSSPLTTADRLSHDIITKGLRKSYGGIPILSEEQKEVPYEDRKNWEWFWLVDPLDGTKEFIKKNGEFTINIALVHNGAPVLGVIYAPVKGELFYAAKGDGAFKTTSLGAKTQLKIKNNEKRGDVIIVVSRSHGSQELQDYVDLFRKRCPGLQEVSIGSSLKFCLVAEGRAHVYPRLGPTMEWDTAAGQIIVEEAGGKVTDVKTKSALRYNKITLLNNHFIASDGRSSHLCMSKIKSSNHSI